MYTLKLNSSNRKSLQTTLWQIEMFENVILTEIETLFFFFANP